MLTKVASCRRNIDLEKVIAQDANMSYEYAIDVIKGRFKLGEPTIAKNTELAYEYAVNVIQGRFKLGESVIATDAKWAYLYARWVFKGRWELGEQSIFKSKWANDYKQMFNIQ